MKSSPLAWKRALQSGQNCLCDGAESGREEGCHGVDCYFHLPKRQTSISQKNATAAPICGFARSKMRSKGRGMNRPRRTNPSICPKKSPPLCEEGVKA